ncbi:MAG: glycerophosphodiester phosphodiesterase family protein [Nanoarchaeota archaeon]
MKPLIIAHRGGSAYEPENTLKAFRKAIKLKVDFIEFDVRLTKDKKLIVFHDRRVDRLTAGKGYVKDLCFRDIRRLGVGGEKIPTPEEAVKLIKNKVGIIIELKDRGCEKKIVNLIRKNNLKNVIVVSFDKKIIKTIKKIDKALRTGLIFSMYPFNHHRVRRLVYDPIKSTSKIGADEIFYYYRYTTKKLVKMAHDNGFKINVWTIDNTRMMKKFIEMGVDGVATNRPNLLKGLF